MEIFGDRLRQLRTSKKLTQEKFINDFNNKFNYNLTKSAVSQYENKKRLPDLNIILNIANYFDVSTDYLFGRNDSGLQVLDNDEVREKKLNYPNYNNQVLNIDSYLTEVQRKICTTDVKVISGKTATKRQIDIINNCIEIGLKLAKKEIGRE